MSKEPGRVTFTTISQPGSSSASSVIAGNETSSSRIGGGEFLTPNTPGSAAGKGGTNKNINKTVRLQLELFATDTCKYPEFNYSKLLDLEKKNENKMKQVSATTNGIGCDPFAENDEDVAKELETKCGTKYVTGRGQSKKKDIGLGYDETDSFIDNTDAYDEVIPEEVETIEGGFRINCGAFEFSNLNNKMNASKTDETIKMPDRPKKRANKATTSYEAEADDDSQTKNDVDIDDENTSNKNDSAKSSTTKKKSYKHEDKRLKPDESSGSSKFKSLNASKKGSKKQKKTTKQIKH